MNQIKYLLQACLIVIALLFAGTFLITMAETSFLAQEEITRTETKDKALTETANSKGALLFRQNCQSCHSLDRNLTGPALRGVEERGPWTDRKNLVLWVQNPAGFLESSPYARDLKDIYDYLMPSFPQLSEEDIHAIFDFLKMQTAGMATAPG